MLVSKGCAASKPLLRLLEIEGAGGTGGEVTHGCENHAKTPQVATAVWERVLVLRTRDWQHDRSYGRDEQGRREAPRQSCASLQILQWCERQSNNYPGQGVRNLWRVQRLGEIIRHARASGKSCEVLSCVDETDSAVTQHAGKGISVTPTPREAER